MIPLGYLAAGALALATITGATGYFVGKDHQRDADRAEVLADVAARAETSRRDERLLADLAGTIGTNTQAALTSADRTAQPIVMRIHDDQRSTPLAPDPRCAVPDSVRDGAAALHEAAERAANAADSAAGLAGRGAQPAAAR